MGVILAITWRFYRVILAILANFSTFHWLKTLQFPENKPKSSDDFGSVRSEYRRADGLGSA
ncbi:MAG: hypothetical protein JWO53_641 [Chlamydiia bacterium]|nr:hypothetical protein [Chlamydiia bacterium]